MIVAPDDFPSVFDGSEAHEMARRLGEVRIYTTRGAESTATLIERIGDAKVAINLRSYVKYSEDVFRACPNLRLVAVWGSGTDNVDLDAAARSGVTVCNTAGVNAGAASEHALALIISLARNLGRSDAEMRKGNWPRDLPGQLEGRKLGVFGVGHVGSRVAKLGSLLGMNVLAWSARGDAARVEALGARPSTKEEIIRECDFLSLHLRLTPDTAGFLGTREFALMQPHVVVVNTARARLIERAALVQALSSGTIAAAGLDVFYEEPTRSDDPLLGLSNTLVTPHVAGQSPEVRSKGMRQVVTNITNYLRGSPSNVVTPA